MVVFWNFVIHALIIVSSAGLVTFMFLLVTDSGTTEEGLIRTMACATGFLVYMGAKAVGLSMPELMFKGLEQSAPIKISTLALILPGPVGWAVAWYCTSSLQSSKIIAARVVLLFSVFILTAFVDVYIATYAVSEFKGELNKALMPNLTFVVGILLYTIFKVDPNKIKP